MSTRADRGAAWLADLLFGHRRLFLALFAAITVLIAWPASRLRVDAAFDRLLPQHHPYMETYRAYSAAFGGGNVLLVALEAKRGDIFTPGFSTRCRR